MSLGTLSQFSLIFLTVLNISCNSGTGLNGSSEKKKSSSDGKAENKKLTSGESDSKSADAEEEEDDLSVIPPEVVSAAYLTCSTSDTETSPEEGDVHFGCNITKKDGRKLEVDPEKCKWDVKSKNGKDIEYEKIESKNPRYQRIFKVAKIDYEYGVKPTAAVEVSDGSVIVVKKPGQVSINGKEKVD